MKYGFYFAHQTNEKRELQDLPDKLNVPVSPVLALAIDRVILSNLS